MNTRDMWFAIAGVAFIIIAIWAGVGRTREPVAPENVLSFADCEKAGYPVLESKPRQCRTPDGRIYAEDMTESATYRNASADDITVELPFPGAVTAKDFSVKGEARGYWFSEASFPVELYDKDGKLLATAIAKAQDDWMTTEFVPFEAIMRVPKSYSGKTTLVIKKDNPSGLPEKDASLSFPITVEY